MKSKPVTYIHLAFWCYMLMQHLFPIIAYPSKMDTQYYLVLPLDFGLMVLSFYFMYLYVLPWLFKFAHKWLAVLVGVCVVVLVSFSTLPIYYYYSKFVVQIPPEKLYFEKAEVLNHIRGYLVSGIYSLLIKIVVDWLHRQQLEAEMKQQNQASELALLRSQINPHFLFNTLNNIYSLVRSKSEDADVAVLKLSEIMRYMLYDSNAEMVSLQKEVDYLNGFIELQKLRLKTPDFVDFKVTGDIDGKMIAPMALIPFVENAFKHGNRQVSSPGIMIDLNVSNPQIQFRVVNQKKKFESIPEDQTGGIGLQNIRRRLNLIYPDKHSLSIDDADSRFEVDLKIYS